jgi:hypothetical protein
MNAIPILSLISVVPIVSAVSQLPVQYPSTFSRRIGPIAVYIDVGPSVRIHKSSTLTCTVNPECSRLIWEDFCPAGVSIPVKEHAPL